MADILFYNVKGVDFGFILDIYRLQQNLYTIERGGGGGGNQSCNVFNTGYSGFLRKKIHPVRPVR